MSDYEIDMNGYVVQNFDDEALLKIGSGKRWKPKPGICGFFLI